MNDWLSSWTYLPNLHPAVVHLPLALVPVAAGFDLVAAFGRRWRARLTTAAAVLWSLAALGAVAAYWTGRQAVDSLHGLPPQVQARISAHSDWALYTTWAVALIALVRLALALRGNERPAALAMVGLLGVGATFMVLRTGDLGGGLVFRYGVAVSPQALAPGGALAGVHHPPDEEIAALPVATPADPPGTRLLRGDDGTLTWRPVAGDREALGTILVPVEGDGLDPVHFVAPQDPEADGLFLHVAGRALLVLPDTFEGVRVDASLDLAGFEGTVGLAHHVRSGQEAGLLRVTVPDGGFQLVSLRGDRERNLDRGSQQLPAGVTELGVYAVGRHFHGYLDGRNVLHGHEPALPPGQVGLLLDGSGELVIYWLRATPVEP
jgi:uncharacterized membrane protein